MYFHVHFTSMSKNHWRKDTLDVGAISVYGKVYGQMNQL